MWTIPGDGEWESVHQIDGYFLIGKQLKEYPVRRNMEVKGSCYTPTPTATMIANDDDNNNNDEDYKDDDNCIADTSNLVKSFKLTCSHRREKTIMFHLSFS